MDRVESEQAAGPLAGLRVLDISNVIAGPLAATLLADFGAEVIKVELPGQGDALRTYPPAKDGVPLWWKVTNRGKRTITLDIRKPGGRALLERLLPLHDALVENFRPGTLAQWGLPAERLFECNPRLVVLRVSGFGQTGPYRDRPGFARVFEAMSGFTHLCGDPDGPPMHLGYPVSDAVGGIFGALGVVSALYHLRSHPAARGQEIDLSMTEAMFRVLEFLAIEYDQLGIARSRQGNRNPYTAPGDVYRSADQRWVTLPVSSPAMFTRLAAAIGHPELIEDPRFRDNTARIANREPLEAIVRAWIGAHTLEEILTTLGRHEVAVSPIYSIDQIYRDPHFQARGAIVELPDPELGHVRMQGVVPRFSQTPCEVRSAGARLGEHNAAVYGELLGLSDEEMRSLADEGVI